MALQCWLAGRKEECQEMPGMPRMPGMCYMYWNAGMPGMPECHWNARMPGMPECTKSRQSAIQQSSTLHGGIVISVCYAS